MLGALHVLSPVFLKTPEDFSYQLALVLAGGDEQLVSQHSFQDGTIEKVIVKRDVDIGEVVLDVPPRQRLRGKEKQEWILKAKQYFFFLMSRSTHAYIHTHTHTYKVTFHGLGSSVSMWRSGKVKFF